MKQHYVITIARGFGSGGKQVAMQLGKTLGINCYEHRILTMASQISGYEEARFREVDEKLKSGHIVNVMRDMPIVGNLISVGHEFKADMQLFEIQKKIILELVKKESCIIVGKCADDILRDYPNKISVYVEADRATCISRIKMRVLNEEQREITDEEASSMIVKNDRYRTEYYKHYTGGKDWRSPVNYDMMLNTGKMGVEGCVDMIRYYLDKKGYLGEEFE